MLDGLFVRRLFLRLLPRLHPVLNRLFRDARLGVVMREKCGLSIDDVLEMQLDGFGDMLMASLPSFGQHRSISRILQQRMIEDVTRF